MNTSKWRKDMTRTSRRRKFKPDAPGQLWETDATYIHCGITDGATALTSRCLYLREGIAHIFDIVAAAHTAVQSVLKAAPSVNYISYPKLRADNGTRYSSRGFNESGQALGTRCKFIWRNTLAKRTCGVFPRSAQDIICFAAQVYTLLGCRGRFSKSICGLQQEYSSL